MNIRKIVLLLTAVILIAFALNFQNSKTQKTELGISTDQSQVNVSVEIADTSSEREKGLMYRKDLKINEGMLFVFPDEAPRSFWMKNTYIPLDIVFLDSNGSVLNVEEAYPQPNASDAELARYRSQGDARYVLELNSSFSEKYGLNTNDRVKFYDALN